MLTYAEAIKKILKHSFRLKERKVSLRDAFGSITSQDLRSPEPFPGFDNSAVDGYAISGGDQTSLLVQTEVRAGECLKGILKTGCAARIFTGAPVPKGTRAVVMQEDTKRVNGHIFLLKQPSENENIRFSGEDFQKGKKLIKKNTLLNSAHLAVLAAVGYEKIPVYPSPKIGILATGSELLKKEEKLTPGKIRDCNSILLEALVKKTGGIPYVFKAVEDDPKKICRSIHKGLTYDLLLISGGVSVGKYDFVRKILKKEGVKEIFWKVDIKPGKPIFFGRKDRTLVFGLPGNPVSIFVTFEKFVKAAILKMMGKDCIKEEIKGRLTKVFYNGSRLHFVRVICKRKNGIMKVAPVKGQGSHMIGSLANSNGLLMVQPKVILKKNEQVFVTWTGEE